MKRFLTVVSLALSASVSYAPLALSEGAKAPAQAELAPQVTLDELKAIVKDKSALIIDANGTSMYTEGHIPGAVSFAKHEGKLTSVLPKDKAAPIVAYCGGPMCTAWEFAAKEAKTLGYTNIKHYKGGIKGWKEAGLPIESGAPKS